MTTAKSQQNNGDNGADDLISELARLMAQDARSDHPTSPVPARSEPAANAAQPQNQPAPGVRIPGSTFRSQPAPRFDPGVSAAAQLVSDLNKSEPPKVAPSVVPAPVVAPKVEATPSAAPAPQRGPLDEIVEPFRFDFGGVSPSIDAILRPGAAAAKAADAPAPLPPQPVEPVVSAPAPVVRVSEPVPRAPEPKPQSEPTPAPRSVAPIVPVAPPVVAPLVPSQDTMEFHDSIADLIAADMAPDEEETADEEHEPEVIETVPEPEPEEEPAPVVAAAPAPEPVRPEQQAPAEVMPEVASRPELTPSRPMARTWTPTPVAGTRPANATPISRSAVRPVNLTPVTRPTREPSVATSDPAPQGDSFKVAPIFGLGGPAATPSAPIPVADPRLGRVSEPTPEPIEPEVHFVPPVRTAPEVTTDVGDEYGTDPIDEIESLIGNAVRVDLDTRHRPVSSAALRDLAKPSAIEPQLTTPPTRVAAAPVSQDPILEAVKASGGEATWGEPVIAADEEFIAAPRSRNEGRVVAPRSSTFRAIAGPLVAVALLLVAGVGLYWVLGLGGRPDAATVPTLVADTAPTKEAPAPVAPTDTQQSVVFKEINGQAPAEDEQLVSRDQSNATEVIQTPPADTNDDGLANRKVRTVTVRPDGTIVSGEDSVAGSTILPVDRPNVPTVPGAALPSPELVAATNGAASAMATNTPAALPATPASTTPAVAPIGAATPTTETTAAPVQPGSIVPVVDASGAVVAGKQAQIPKVRPSQFTNLDRPAPTSAANAVSNGPIPLSQALGASNTQAAAPPVGGNAPAYVQLSSQRSQADAQASAINLANRYGSLFNGAQPEIQKVDLGAKGTFYRVRVPAASQQAASAICGSIKANGGECF